jgi:hypothetical protein
MKADSFSIPMTVDQARAVLWTFREYKGQSIGSLLDNGLITLRDLGFAVERAYDKRVKEASKTLLLNALTQAVNEPQTPVDPLNVITSERRSFSERRQLQLMLLNGLVGGIFLGASWFFAIQLLFFRSRQSVPDDRPPLSEVLSTSIGLAAFIIVLLIIIGIPLLLYWLVQWIGDRIDYQIQLFRKGQRGEERILDAMYHSLDGNWWLFRNLDLPGQKIGDVDYILVGKNGVRVLEVKSYGGVFRTVGDKWERLIARRWLPTFTNPTRQAKRNAAALSHILSTHDIKQWVTPVVIWANPDATLKIENPSIDIWHLYQISDALSNLSNERTISDDQKMKIVETLKSLYQEPFLSDGSQES